MYSKVFKSVYYGSLRKEPEAREVFICLLTHVIDRHGSVDMTPEVLSSLLQRSLEHVEAALHVLEAPDPHSTSPDEEGRRIVRTSTGWRVVNYRKYLGIRNEMERREQNREAKQRQRLKVVSASVSHGQPRVSNVSPSVSVSVSESLSVSKSESKKTPARIPSLPKFDPQSFTRFWDRYPKKKGRAEACVEWDKLKPERDLLLEMSAGLERYIRETEPKFVVYPDRFLRRKRWEDEPGMVTDRASVLKELGRRMKEDEIREQG